MPVNKTRGFQPIRFPKVAPIPIMMFVGTSGEIQTSDDDGETWVHQTSGTANSLRGVAYSSTLGRWCVVGDSGTIRTSDDDGASWTPRTPGSSYAGSFQGVSFGNGLFVATGTSGEIQTSPDGITWTRRTPAGGASTTCYAPTYWSVTGLHYVHFDGDGSSTGVRVQSSPNGVTWTNRFTSNSADDQMNEVAVNGLSMRAAGQFGVEIFTLNGTSWTRTTLSGFPQGAYQTISYSSAIDTFFVGGDVSNSQFGVIDGTTGTHTAQTAPSSSDVYASAPVSTGGFVIGLLSGGGFYKSATGLTGSWSSRTADNSYAGSFLAGTLGV